jgi:hypothetical protein
VSGIGKAERATQNRVVKLFRDDSATETSAIGVIASRAPRSRQRFATGAGAGPGCATRVIAS